MKLSKAREGIYETAKQEVFLKALAKHGLFNKAAREACVSLKAVSNLRFKDPEFEEAVMEALGEYSDKVIEHHQNLLFEGTQKETFDRNGNLVTSETIYPIRLIELELKKVDEAYRDKREVNMNVNGGVLVAPPEVESIDDWEKRFAEAVVINPEASQENEE